MPIDLSISYSNEASAPASSLPITYNYTKNVLPNATDIVELPATDANGASLTYSIVQQPAHATLVSNANNPYVLLRPLSGASGNDTIVFRATSSFGSSTGTVSITYAQ